MVLAQGHPVNEEKVGRESVSIAILSLQKIRISSDRIKKNNPWCPLITAAVLLVT